jgi:hypothetical protein
MEEWWYWNKEDSLSMKEPTWASGHFLSKVSELKLQQKYILG